MTCDASTQKCPISIFPYMEAGRYSASIGVAVLALLLLLRQCFESIRQLPQKVVPHVPPAYSWWVTADVCSA